MKLLTDAELERVVRSIRLVAFDFDGVFTDNAVYVSSDGIESVRCWRGDGLGLRKLERLGLEMMIISTEKNPVVSKRAAKLGIHCEQGVDDKRAVLQSAANRHGIEFEHIAFVGNDSNDLACLTGVGLPIGVADSHPDILDCVRYRTGTKGGYGAVREVCDLFERIRGS